MICLFIFQSSYGAPSGCDRMVVCQLAQGDPKMIHCGNYYISCMYTSITVYEAVLVPSVMKVQARFCPSLEKVQSRLSSPGPVLWTCGTPSLVMCLAAAPAW